MKTPFSSPHKKRFTDIKASLAQLGCREDVFIRIELLFFEVVGIAREYGNELSENSLLKELKNLQTESYADACDRFVKPAQREKAIRRFVNELKIVLTKANKDMFPHASNKTTA